MNSKKKANLLSEYCNLFFFWLIAIFFFFLFRLSFILINFSEVKSDTGLFEYFQALFMGFRFDVTVISYFLIAPLLSTLILIPLHNVKLSIAIRLFFQKLFVVTGVLISIITLNYYEEYRDQFNHFLFMGLYDDTTAVFHTIVSDFHIIENSLIIFGLIYSWFKIFSHFENEITIYNFLIRLNFKHQKILYSTLFLILFVVSIRGSFTEYPVRRYYSAVTSDDFLNKTIINPFRSLTYAISDFNDLNEHTDVNPFGPLPHYIQSNYTTFNEVLKKKTSTKFIENQPNQVFLVVMESYDSWPLMDAYKGLNVSSQLSRIQSKGVHFPNFLPASNSTMNSFASIVTNIPYFGKNISILGASTSFSTSMFEQFKELGYQTNFFYGGYLSWQNIQNFVKNQGADNVYGAGDISVSKGIWGVDDESLFEAVLENVDPTHNSLNVILTMSYHPPYEIDVDSKKFPYQSIKDVPNNYNEVYDEKNMPLKVLGHLWYADKALGDFVSKAEKKYGTSLFAFTGDHFSRKFLNGFPTLYEQSSVPFILYGKPVNNRPGLVSTPGSHIDIMPTLIDLVAPPNYTYYSFGNSLFETNKSTMGIAHNKTIDVFQIQKFSKNTGVKKQVFQKPPNPNYKPFEAKIKHDSLMSLAWHYTIKGDTIRKVVE